MLPSKWIVFRVISLACHLWSDCAHACCISRLRANPHWKKRHKILRLEFGCVMHSELGNGQVVLLRDYLNNQVATCHVTSWNLHLNYAEVISILDSIRQNPSKLNNRLDMSSFVIANHSFIAAGLELFLYCWQVKHRPLPHIPAVYTIGHVKTNTSGYFNWCCPRECSK